MAADDTIPARIGRYEVERLVGEGAMAKVYRARDPEIDRIVAIKVLKEDVCVNEEIASRFVREAKAAGAISHPNIVAVYDVGRIGNSSYITMEFIEEDSLAELFAAQQRLPVKNVLKLGIQLARALDHAHRRGIVHRDIKPGNILLMENRETVKITDFGIARLGDSDDLGKTHAGMVLGTPRYMSPEQAAGQNVDGRSDLFSLGVILYELLTGKKAFDSNSVATLMLQIMQQEPPSVRSLAPEVPVGLQRIVARLLQKRPDKRFQTGAQLAEALERELAAIVEQEEDAKRNKFIPLRIRWAAMAGGTLALVFLIGVAIVYTLESRVIRSQVLDSGSALAKFVATETAVPVLSQNWVPLELFVQDASQRGSFDYLVVTDHQNIVKASTEKALVGKAYTPPTDAEQVLDAPDVKASSVDLANGRSIFLFDTPILFQKTEIGRIRLGVNRTGMDRVLGSTLFFMSLLGVLAVISVVAMVYVFGGLLARPMRVLSKALVDFGAGDLDRRVSQQRNDEIGELFSAFNQMAEGVQANAAKRGAAASAPAARYRTLEETDAGLDDTVVLKQMKSANA